MKRNGYINIKTVIKSPSNQLPTKQPLFKLVRVWNLLCPFLTGKIQSINGACCGKKKLKKENKKHN